VPASAISRVADDLQRLTAQAPSAPRSDILPWVMCPPELAPSSSAEVQITLSRCPEPSLPRPANVARKIGVARIGQSRGRQEGHGCLGAKPVFAGQTPNSGGGEESTSPDPRRRTGF